MAKQIEIRPNSTQVKVRQLNQVPKTTAQTPPPPKIKK